jgi:hypothetical protein
LNIDGPLKKGAIFDGNAGCRYVSREGGRLTQFHTFCGVDIAINFAVDYDITGFDVSANASIRPDSQSLPA